MIKEYLVVFSSCFLIVNFANASWFDGKIQDYYCKNGNSIDALSCNNKCQKTGIDLEFQINIDSNLVLKKMYIKSKLVDTSVLQNCKVIDKKNWICETVSVSSFLKYEKFVDQHFMNDGVYANTTFVNNVQDRFPSCAK
jgi:hypothetical protein